MEAMEEYMRPDRAKHAVLPISKFGLMQITRQRMKPEMNINTQEVCPTCAGTDKISSTLLLEDELKKISATCSPTNIKTSPWWYILFYTHISQKADGLIPSNGNGDGNTARRLRFGKTLTTT